MLRVTTILFFYLAFILTQTSSIYAKEKPFLSGVDLKEVNISEYEKVNPNLLIYPFKRIGENMKLTFILNKSKKNEYLLNLYEIRFKELVYIINYNKVGFIGFSVDRYNTFIGTVKSNPIPLDKEKIKKKIKILEKLRDRYHSGIAPWEKIQQSIDTTKSLI